MWLKYVCRRSIVHWCGCLTTLIRLPFKEPFDYSLEFLDPAPTLSLVFFSTLNVIFPPCDVGTSEVKIISCKSDSKLPSGEFSYQGHLFQVISSRRMRWRIGGAEVVNVGEFRLLPSAIPHSPISMSWPGRLRLI